MSFEPVFPEFVAIEVDLGAGWVELEDMLTTVPIEIQRGISGTSQRDRVAQTGTMTFTLDNSETNSQGVLGLYSLNNVNTLAGWRLGIPVRCVITFLAVERVVFVGTIDGVQPVSGMYGPRTVSVSCVDWMEEAAKAEAGGFEIQIGKRSDEILSMLLDTVEVQPTARYIGYGGDVYPYALDNAFDETLNVMSEVQRLMQSELGYGFVSREGTFTFQGRHRRPNLFTLSATLTDADLSGGALDTSRGREEIINRAQVQAHPRRVDAAATSVLFDLASTPQVMRNTSQNFHALYRDPDARATRAGGVDMVTPVATTDYTFNSEEDGTGTDLTDQLIVTATFAGNSADVEVENLGPQDGYLTKLQLRGKGVYAYETTLAFAESAASMAIYGENTEVIDMPYQHDPNVAQDAASFIVAQGKDLLTQVRAATFIGNREERLLRYALEVDIGERVRVEETVVGTAGKTPVGEPSAVSALEFFINAVALSIVERGIIRCTWTLIPADSFTYWILEKDGFTELDETTRLGYGSFLAGWIVGESEVGVSTRVNA